MVYWNRETRDNEQCILEQRTEWVTSRVYWNKEKNGLRVWYTRIEKIMINGYGILEQRKKWLTGMCMYNRIEKGGIMNRVYWNREKNGQRV